MEHESDGEHQLFLRLFERFQRTCNGNQLKERSESEIKSSSDPEIVWNTEKNHGYLKRHAVTQTSVKNHLLN